VNPVINCWVDTITKVLTPLATILVAGYVAFISWRQWKNSQQELRLDLYQRRFEIYLRVIEFHLAFMQWQDEPKLTELHGPFMKAYCESKFLFPKESGIYGFLDEYNLHTSRVRVYKNRGDVNVSQAERVQLANDQKWIKDCIGDFEEKLGPFLNFHSI